MPIAFIGFVLFFAAYTPTNMVFNTLRPENLGATIPYMRYVLPALLAYAVLKVHPISVIVKGEYKGKREIIVGSALSVAFLLTYLVSVFSGYAKLIEVHEVVVAFALAQTAGQFLLLVGLYKLVRTPHTPNNIAIN